MNILNSLRWVHTDALAAKITQGRSEKLAIAQQRHLLSRLNAMIDGCFTRGEKFFHSSTSWDTRSTFRLKTSERKAIFTSAVEIPLHKNCSFLLPACQGKSRPHAEQRAVAQTVSLLTSRSSLHDMFASISKGKFTNFVDLLSDADCYASINISEIEASDNSRKTGNQWMSPSETTSFVVTVTSSSISSIDGVGVGIDTRPTEEDENESVLARATSQDIYGALRSALDDAIRSLHFIMEKEGIELANELQLITLPRNPECRAGGSDSILRSYLCESLSFFDAAGITTINSAVYLTASEDVRASSIVQRLQRLSPSTLARSTCICSPWPTAVPEFSVERCLYSLNLLLQSVCSPSNSEAVASFHFGAGKQLSSCSPVTLTYCGADDNAGTVSSIAASVNQKIRTPQYWRQFCPLPGQMEIGEQLYFQSSHPFQLMFNYLAAAWLCVDRVLISSPHESTAAIHSGPLYAVSWAATLSPDKFIVNGNGIPTCNFFARSIIAADACVTSSVLPNAVLLSWWSRSLLGCRSNASVNMQLPLPAATQRAIGSASSYIHYLSLKKECQTVPDIIVMVQQMRERLGMSEDSFPSIKFSQRAYHSPQLQTLRLQGGEFGDVDVFTEVVAQWGPLGPFVAVSNPVKRHCGGNNTKVSTNPIEGNGNTRGPLQLLVNVLCRLYREVFPLSNYPLISVRHFATRKGLDFLLFSWFDSPPQVRTFEITATTPSTQTRIKFIRAMLFYDILGQRVLFGETHHFNSKEAICHLEVLAVSLNFPTSDPQSSESIGKEVHPKVLSPVFRAKHQQHVFETHEAHFRQFIYRCCHSAVAPPATVPADALKSFLTMVAHHRCPLGAMLSLIEEIYEGVVQLSVHPKEIDPLTRSHGYLWEDWAVGKRLPPLCGAVTLSLFRDSKERSMNQREAERTLTAEYGVKPGSSLFSAFQDIGRRLLEELLTEPLCHNIAGSSCRRRIIELCEDATSPILLRNGFPLFSAKDYHPPHLLGMVLQGVAGRYNCRYEHVPVGLNVIPASQDHFHQEGSVPTTFYCSPCENSEDSLSSTALVMCLVELPTLCGRDNSAGPSTPESIAGFPIGIGFGSTIKSAWASAAWNALRNNFPDVVAQLDLFRHVSETLRGPALLSVPQMANGLRWIWHPSLEKSECIVVSGEKRDNRGETGVARGVGQSAQQAYQRGAENFIKRTRDSAAENKLKFSSWRVETNFTKSIWHAYCGFLGALLGRRVQLASVRCSESSNIGLVLYCRHSCSNAQSEATRSCTSQILCSLKLSHVSPYCPLFDSGACTGGSCIREAQSAASMASQSVAQKSIRLLLGLTHALRDESMRVALTAQHSSILSEGALKHELNVLLSSLRQRMQQHAIGCHHLSNLRKAELLLEMWTGCQARTSVRCVSVQWRAEALVWLPKSSMSISGGNDFRPQVLLQCIGDSRHEAVSELLASIIAAIGLAMQGHHVRGGGVSRFSVLFSKPNGTAKERRRMEGNLSVGFDVASLFDTLVDRVAHSWRGTAILPNLVYRQMSAARRGADWKAGTELHFGPFAVEIIEVMDLHLIPYDELLPDDQGQCSITAPRSELSLSLEAAVSWKRSRTESQVEIDERTLTNMNGNGAPSFTDQRSCCPSSIQADLELVWRG